MMPAPREAIEQMGGIIEELEADNTRAWMQVEALTRERDEALALLQQEIARLEALNAAARRRYEELAETCDEAQEAAETYHTAWQDLKEEPNSP